MKIRTSKKLQKLVEEVQSQRLQKIACAFVSGEHDDFDIDSNGIADSFLAGMKMQEELQKIYDRSPAFSEMYCAGQVLHGGGEDIFYFCGRLDDLCDRIKELIQ